MNPIVLTIFLALNIKSGLAAVAFGKAEEHPNYPGQCYDPATNVAHGVSSQWPMKDGCGSVMCETMGSALYFSYSTCPSVTGPSECIVVENNKAAYPECCPRLKCPEFDNEIHDDQIMMASYYDDENLPATYDVTLDYDNGDNQESIFKREPSFSNIFPLWRDFGRVSSLGIAEESKPNLYSPR